MVLGPRQDLNDRRHGIFEYRSGFILTNEFMLKMQIEGQTMYRNVHPGLKGRYERKN